MEKSFPTLSRLLILIWQKNMKKCNPTIFLKILKKWSEKSK